VNVQTVMRNCLFAIVALSCGVFCASSSYGEQDPSGTKPDAAAGFKVAGLVVSSTTGTPLRDTRVTLENTKNRREAVGMITREDGRFEFAGLGAGKYSLEGARRGYIPAAYQQHEQYSTAIVTGEKFDTQNLTLRLVPMAMLTGKVLDEYGEGVRDARVMLYVESHRGGATRVTSASLAISDDQGMFEFTPLEPGKYYASVSAKPWYAVRPASQTAEGAVNAVVDVDRSLDVAYPTTYSGGSKEAEGAEPIAIKGGDHAQIDIHLSPVQALHLIFHAADSGEDGFRPPIFQKRSFDSEDVAPTEGIQQISEGVFEMSGIPAGRYTVRMPGNGSEQMAHAEVELKQDGQDLAELRGEPAGRVKLSVKMPKDEPPPRQMSVGLRDDQHRIVGFNHQLDPNGEATFEDLAAGKYGIYTFFPGKVYAVARMTSGDIQVFGHEFNLPLGASQEWTVSLAAGRTQIEGFVKRGDKAASGVMVVLVPKDPETHQEMFRRDQSDLDGSFALADVVPGSYTVVAVEDAWGFDWLKPSLLARYAEHGQTLMIGELIQGVVDLPEPVQVQPR
jgi:Carboxypeptidase regulatory-like domain